MPYSPSMEKRTRVIIIGGGFGGLNAAKALRNTNVSILLIDKTNHHLFQPLLYQVATAALSPGNIAMPIREILKGQENITVIMGEVTRIDKSNQTVSISHGDIYHFDYLIAAPGARHSYFGHEEWESFAPGLKSLSDAIDIRESVLLAFERAERSPSSAEVEKLLRFVIIGGGPTGVEMAGAIAEIAYKTLFLNFRKIKPELSKIYLLEGSTRLLNDFSEKLSTVARNDLEKMGVKVLTNTFVTNISEKGVYIGETLIPTCNVIWAAGNQASHLLKTLEIPLDKAGRAFVGKDLAIPEFANIFIIGDAALTLDSEGKALPGIAPVAIQQGMYVAKVIGRSTPEGRRYPFQYHDKGTMATIGKAKAVAMIGKYQFSGFMAWLTWCLIHIFYLVSFPNRILVMLQWIFWYITGKRSVRLIKKNIDENADEAL